VVLFVVLIAMSTVLSATQSVAVDLDDIYKKQLEIEHRLWEIQIDLVSRISHDGNEVAAKADLNNLECSQYIVDMPNFGMDMGHEHDRRQGERQDFFEERWFRCNDLDRVFNHLPYRDRILLFTKFSYQLAGYGEDPYQEVWRYIKSDAGMLGRLKAELLSSGTLAGFIEGKDKTLSAKPSSSQ